MSKNEVGGKFVPLFLFCFPDYSKANGNMKGLFRREHILMPSSSYGSHEKEQNLLFDHKISLMESE